MSADNGVERSTGLSKDDARRVSKALEDLIAQHGNIELVLDPSTAGEGTARIQGVILPGDRNSEGDGR